jgi:leucyl-tRNA synthetase
VTPAIDDIAGSIESKWQRFWEERETFRARPQGAGKFYCYNPAPYVTGVLHMGHVRNYTYGDFLSKFRRLHGANVLYTIGFDAFGVPTEVAAMQRRMTPVSWTADCIERMKQQLGRMGFGFDWRRSFSTADPDYYKWTQWIFIEMFREGIVYEREAETLWCPSCGMALAKSQTEAGRCSSCDGVVEARIARQWFLRLSRYLDRLRSDLPDVRDLNGQARAGQESLLSFRNLWGVWLARPDSGAKILACLGSRGDWSKNLVLAVHPQDWPARRKLGLWGSEEEEGARGIRDAGEPGAPPAGSPVERVTVASDSGRVFRVLLDPTLDEIYLDQPVLLPAPRQACDVEIEPGPPEELFPLALNEQKDFSISRQRFWGTPIPMVRCGTCGPLPVGEGDLPVLMPRIEVDDSGRLRRSDLGWADRTCPSCGRPAKLDAQVMDCHFDALWHYIRPCVGPTEGVPFGTDEARYWMPVDQIQFGRDTIPFLLTLRLFTKFLMDRGLSDCSEFARETLAHGLILKDNRKMSKHLGNVVDPEEMIQRFGADSLRFYVLARNEPKSDYSWSDASLARYHDLLNLYLEDLGAGTSGETLEGEGQTGARSMGKYTSIFLTKVLREAEVMESSVNGGRFDIYARAVARVLEALHLFRARYYAQAGSWGREAWWKCAELSIVWLAPISPHVAEECWERRGGQPSLFDGAQWPFDGPAQIKELLEQAKKRRES